MSELILQAMQRAKELEEARAAEWQAAKAQGRNTEGFSLNAKFPGKCKDCGTKHAAGSMVRYYPNNAAGQKLQCLGCYGKNKSNQNKETSTMGIKVTQKNTHKCAACGAESPTAICQNCAHDNSNNDANDRDTNGGQTLQMTAEKLGDEFSYKQLVDIFKDAHGSTFGFNYAVHPATAKKADLARYIMEKCEQGKVDAAAEKMRSGGNQTAGDAQGKGSADGAHGGEGSGQGDGQSKDGKGKAGKGKGEGGEGEGEGADNADGEGQGKQEPPPENETEAEKLLRVMREAMNASKSPLDEDRVREIVHEEMDETINALREGSTKNIVLKLPDGTAKKCGKQHKQFEELLMASNARDMAGYRLNVWLRGPAGSGKTTAAHSVAKALDLQFYFTGAIDTEYKLLGFVDAHGKLNSRQFRTAYENGGVFLFDEVDGSMAGALLALNAALANGMADFPDGVVERHKDFVCIAAANTWGQGATSDYIGRNRLDGAFIDRFVQIDWLYDEDLEESLTSNKAWFKKVKKWRAAAAKMGLKVIISPRSTYFGEALLAQGLSEEKVIAMTVRKGMTDEQWNSLKAAA